MNSHIFDDSNLVRTYAPPSLGAVMIGNKVALRSGGPRMIVYDIAPDGSAMCNWITDGKMHKELFPLCMLTCFGAK